MENPSDASGSFPILGERFEFRENGSLKVDFEAKVIEFDSCNPNHIRRLERILKQRLLNELEPAVREYSEKLEVEFRRITIRKPKTRWGSCSSNGALNFNLWLVCLPRDLIRYVACHEVAHLRENHHGRAFWEIVRGEFEDYKVMKKKLSEYWSIARKTNLLFGPVRA